MKTSKHVDCDKCGTLTVTRKETGVYRRRGGEYRLTGVEVEVCPACGERYYHSSSVTQINRRIDALAREAPTAA